MTNSSKKNREVINGVLLLDKKYGLSSNQALQQVKKLFNAKKVGHTGTLDPLATGLLILCFGKATKLCNDLIGADKRYLVTLTLGTKTTTGDSEGEVIAKKPIPKLDATTIANICDNFTGTISQIPPMHSALKHKGRPLYYYARRGEEIERPAREVSIFSLIAKDLTDNSLTLEVHCSKGTYIRTLAEDIGTFLGTYAYVTKLRRLSIADYNVSAAVTVEKVTTTEDKLSLLLA